MKSAVIQERELGNVQSSIDYFTRFNIPKDAKILDIGCNYGSLVYNLYRMNYTHVRGIDVNNESIGKGKIDYSDISANIDAYDGVRIPFDNETFDVVLMFDVIEHIPDPYEFIRNEVYRILKKEGVFIFQTPNKLINIPWEILQQKSFTRWKKFHCSLQTRRSLQVLLKESGFSEIIIQKNDIITEHNIIKVRKVAGMAGVLVLHILQRMPLFLYPNLWGMSIKEPPLVYSCDESPK